MKKVEISVRIELDDWVRWIAQNESGNWLAFVDEPAKNDVFGLWCPTLTGNSRSEVIPIFDEKHNCKNSEWKYTKTYVGYPHLGRTCIIIRFPISVEGWVKWVAQNENGDWFMFNTEPEPAEETWKFPDINFSINSDVTGYSEKIPVKEGTTLVPNMYWKNSKTQVIDSSTKTFEINVDAGGGYSIEELAYSTLFVGEKNNGGLQQDYYLVKVDKPVREELEPYTAECQDLIENLHLNWNQANIFKELWRWGNESNDNGKEGNTALRAAEKIYYYAERLLAQTKESKNDK